MCKKKPVLWMLLLFWLNMAQNLTSVTTKLIAACLQLGLRTPILCRHWILPLCRVITIKEVTLLSHSHFPSLCHNRYYDRDNSDISQVILWRHGQRILVPSKDSFQKYKTAPLGLRYKDFIAIKRTVWS